MLISLTVTSSPVTTSKAQVKPQSATDERTTVADDTATRPSAQARVALSSRVINDMRQLHARTQAIEEHGRGRGVRRELREARQAEADFLRFLGFETYPEFEVEAADRREFAQSPAARAQADAPRPTTIDELRARVDQLETDLKEAKYEIRRACEALARLPNVATDSLADARAAFFEASAQLAALHEALQERADVDAVRRAAEATAEEILAEARDNSRKINELARKQVAMMIRDAEVTIAGLHEIAEVEVRERGA
jgi:hypothetical protein